MKVLDPAWGMAGFIDVETTGLNPQRDEVIELAVVLFSFRTDTGQVTNIIDEYVGLREPSVRISSAAARVHGITRAETTGKMLDRGRVEGMLESASFLVAHNASFDKSFVDRLFPGSISKPWYCSMRGIPWRNEGFRSRSLQHLLDCHGISIDLAHRAVHDAKASIELLSCRGKNGTTYLLELLRNGPMYNRLA